MSTRGNVRVVDNNDRLLVNIYNHSDSYPEGLGAKLVMYLRGIEIVNGLGLNEGRRVANGMDCLAAQLVAFLKRGPGGVYLYPINETDSEEFVYTVYPMDKKIGLRCESDDGTLYDGPAEDWDLTAV